MNQRESIGRVVLRVSVSLSGAMACAVGGAVCVYIGLSVGTGRFLAVWLLLNFIPVTLLAIPFVKLIDGDIAFPRVTLRRLLALVAWFAIGAALYGHARPEMLREEAAAEKAAVRGLASDTLLLLAPETRSDGEDAGILYALGDILRTNQAMKELKLRSQHARKRLAPYQHKADRAGELMDAWDAYGDAIPQERPEKLAALKKLTDKISQEMSALPVESAADRLVNDSVVDIMVWPGLETRDEDVGEPLLRLQQFRRTRPELARLWLMDQAIMNARLKENLSEKEALKKLRKTPSIDALLGT